MIYLDQMHDHTYLQYMLVCLGLFILLENFSLMWRGTIAGEGLQILTYDSTHDH